MAARGGRHTDLFTGGAGPAIRLFESDERRPPNADVGFEALHSLYWLVVNIADQAPTLILVDDCQWADWDSLARERLGGETAEEFCRACHIATGGNPLVLRELLRALDGAGIKPSAAAAGEVHTVRPAAVSRFVLHRLAARA